MQHGALNELKEKEIYISSGDVNPTPSTLDQELMTPLHSFCYTSLESKHRRSKSRKRNVSNQKHSTESSRPCASLVLTSKARHICLKVRHGDDTSKHIYIYICPAYLR